MTPRSGLVARDHNGDYVPRVRAYLRPDIIQTAAPGSLAAGLASARVVDPWYPRATRIGMMTAYEVRDAWVVMLAGSSIPATATSFRGRRATSLRLDGLTGAGDGQ